MEKLSTRETVRIPAEASSETELDFKPTGAIAFFTVLIILGMIIWFGIYFLMLKRS